ncbi:hypothetical protein DDZ14_08500 [Maritimibacter sp. 55A14]|nr:hypothetical protein DDZ14_08500 [Maritimibacter sp. 55A14]
MGAVFRDRNLTVAATWRALPDVTAVPVRLIRLSPDAVAEWNGGRLIQDTNVVELLISAAPNLAEGHRIEIGAEVFEVVGTPQRDSDRLVWRVELTECEA